MPSLIDKKFTQAEIDSIISDMSIDLIAYYKVLESVVYELVNIASKDGWDEEKLLFEVEKLFGFKENDNQMSIGKSLKTANQFLRKLLDG